MCHPYHEPPVQFGLYRYGLPPDSALIRPGGKPDPLSAHPGQKTIRAEAQPLQQIASLLGHLPLALHIVAQRLKHEPGWSVAGMLARLQQAKRPLDLLVWGDQSVRRQFAASYASLPLAEQTLFASLGCFSGSFCRSMWQWWWNGRYPK